MKNLSLYFLVFILCGFTANTQTLLKYDNDRATSNSVTKKAGSVGWIESVFFSPTGPAKFLKIIVRLEGTKKGKDTLHIVGDPAEGGYPPTNWVWSYNELIPPIVIDYDGVARWDTIDISNYNLRSDGFDRIIVQHIVKSEGPHISMDNGNNVRSYWSDPYTKNQYGFAWDYSRPVANFMVRAIVQYDFPNATNSGSMPAPAATLPDVSKLSGLIASNGKIIKSARVSVADWNNDGYDDIVFDTIFFQNRGDGMFINVSDKIKIRASGITWGDYDNDGNIDCYAVSGGVNDKIYHNNGDGTFTDVTEKSGVENPYPTITPIWLDYNHDGKLDLYISNGRTADANRSETYFQDKLWKNNGNGTFQDVSDDAGLGQGEATPVDCWAASACDYNTDGWTDIFVANYRLAGDFLYSNKKDGTFSEIANETGVIGEPTDDPNYFGHGLGSDWGDFNNDGLPDLAVGNLGHPDERGRWSNPSLIYKNGGAKNNYKFQEVHKQMGLKFFEMNSAMVWLDLDLDGWLDLYHCQYAYNPVGSGEPRRISRMYLNTGIENNFKLKDATWQLGNSVHGVWTAVRTDYDNDGDLDLIVASPHDGIKLFKNNVERKGKWLKIRLVGSPENNINKDCYGTSVIVYSAGKMFYRDLQGGGSGVTASQNSNELHFGLGNNLQIDSIVIKYTNGVSRTITGLKPNTGYKIEYGKEPIITLGVAETIQIKGGISIIPNPINGLNATLRVNTALLGNIVDIELSTISGNKIFTNKSVDAHNGTYRLDLSELQSGSYVVVVTGKGKTTSEKIIIER